MASETYEVGDNAPGHDDVFEAEPTQTAPQTPLAAAQPATAPVAAASAPDDPFEAEAAPASDPNANQSMGDFLHQQLGEIKDAGVGFAHSAGQTVATAGHLLSHLGPMDETGKQRLQWLDNHTENTTDAQKMGGGIESVMEFLGGDEALKGLSVAERLGKLGGIAKLLEAHPTLAKIATLGATSLRQGAVGAGQAGAHGADASEMTKRGAEVAGGSAGLGLAADAAAGGFNKLTSWIAKKGTDAADRSLSGVLANGSGLGDNFDPDETTSAIAPVLRQTFADDPKLAREVLKGDPKESYRAFEKGVRNTQNKIDEAHRETLGQVREYPVSMRSTLDAIDEARPEGLRGYGPDDAAAIDDLKQRVASVRTLGEKNGLRRYLTDELAPSFKKDGVAANRSAAVERAMRAALDETRGSYYDELANASGQNFKPLKQLESHILDARESLGNAKSGLFKKQAKNAEPTTLMQKAEKAAGAIGKVVTGHTKDLAQDIPNGETPLSQTHASMKRFVRHAVSQGSDGFEAAPKVTSETTPNGASSKSVAGVVGPGDALATAGADSSMANMGTPPPDRPGMTPLAIGSGDAITTGRSRPTTSSQEQGYPELGAPASQPALPGRETRALPANASASNPRVRYPNVDPRFAKTRVQPNQFNQAQPASSAPFEVDPNGVPNRKLPQLGKGSAAKAKSILGSKKRKPAS